jgi:protein TonB
LSLAKSLLHVVVTRILAGCSSFQSFQNTPDAKSIESCSPQKQSPGRDVRTLQPAPASSQHSSNVAEPDADQHPVVPVVAVASGLVSMPGAVDGLAPLSDSRGSGRGPGSGPGDGSGDGPGRGSGLGDGLGQGTGGRAYRPGNGVTPPTEIHRGIPKYTADAMRARLQGVVLVGCVVEFNGRCSRTRVVRGLEPSFGLNEEAVHAAEEWRFRPGTRAGQPVPVIVTMEIAFVLR